MKAEFTPYLVQCITNLHAGSGDTNQGMIDKMVQRDHITNYPTIHSTSMKGALREHFKYKWNDETKLAKVFGSDTDEKDTGSHKFLSADLLALPIRATHHQFVYGISKDLVDQTNQKSTILINKNIFSDAPKDDKDYYFGSGINEFYAEDFLLSANSHTNSIFKFSNTIIDRAIASFKEDHFSVLVKSLPVVARNRVGEEKNLWYEEVVPAKTIFITYIGGNTDSLILDEELIQIGANASVGLGLCKFSKIKI